MRQFWSSIDVVVFFNKRSTPPSLKQDKKTFKYSIMQFRMVVGKVFLTVKVKCCGLRLLLGLKI